MKNIGKYNGIPCYECTHKEYVNAYNKNLDNGEQIFIIDGTMVRRNVIIGYYDGKHVKDVYDGKIYFVEEMPTAQKKATFKAENSKWNEKFVEEVKAKQEGASYEELVKQDIDFGKYSTVVDQFFALLEV